MNVLEKIIRGIITQQGAISVAAYMELALQHPDYGYYRVREPVGREGDFITAPEVSQMFGEMIGVWGAESWRSLGKPNPFALVELGPGRGTMMQDIMRATAHVGGFHDAMRLCLLDSDKELRRQQCEKLGEREPHHIDDITQLPPLPAIIVANEFFDALPVRQFEKTFHGWMERMVTVQDNALVMALKPITQFSAPILLPNDALPGTVSEICPHAQKMMRELARHLATHHGAMLVVDYGYVAASGAATLQAISKHAGADIFDRPGEIDLTAHVDFTVLAETAHECGVHVSPVIGQGEFLKNLGIEIRADALKKRATLPQAAEIEVALRRLIDEDCMGCLFKAMEIRG